MGLIKFILWSIVGIAGTTFLITIVKNPLVVGVIVGLIIGVLGAKD